MWLYAISLEVFNKVTSVSEANLMTPHCLHESGCDLIISFTELCYSLSKLVPVSLHYFSLMIVFGGDHTSEFRKELYTEPSLKRIKKVKSN